MRKCIVILGDGMADEPLAELGGKTPIEYARTPNMDYIAREGRSGMVRTVPPGFEPGSDIANLSVLGYDPRSCYTGRGPLEAASMGIDLAPGEVAYRCNLVTVRDGVMEDFSAEHISSGEGKALLEALEERAGGGVRFVPGISYRNLLVMEGVGARTTPPHDIVGLAIEPYLPKGPDATVLLHCMVESEEVFAAHPVNEKRKEVGKRPATMIWPWSGGGKPALQAFSERWGRSGGMIAAVDLLNGIARCAGMEVVRVPGATGYLDTDYEAKARYAVEALKRLDFVYLHVEAPDEAGHLGSTAEKVKAIERVDGICGTILEETDAIVAVLPDHPTPVRIKTHTSDPVPVAVLGLGQDDVEVYSEAAAQKGSLAIGDATGLLGFLFSDR
jgi:2,3-bisphosphoglycerate-independent phosphoglycerate mutase